MFFRKKSRKKETAQEPVKSLKAMISGEIIPLEDVADPVFSSKALGKGIAIRPDGQVITAPCAGKISMIADTLHAIGITLNNGAELIIHEGLDTVSMNGEGFKVKVKNGEEISQGTPILEFDKALIEEKGFAADCILIVTNSDQFPDLTFTTERSAVQNETEICSF